MGQQYYIKTEQCEQIHELGYIKTDAFNVFVNIAIREKIAWETKTKSDE